MLFPAPLVLLALGAPLFGTSSFIVWVIVGLLVGAAFVLGVAGDALVHARRQRHTYVLKPFNRVAVYVAVFVVLGIAAEATKRSIRANVVRAFRMPSESMRPTFEVGDYFFADMSPVARRPARGDLVVHRYPPDPTKELVKRVVAAEGDGVELRNKVLYVNGVKVPEPYVIHTDPSVRPGDLDPRDNYGPVTVPQGSFFVMGDNRDNSDDSRFFGPISRQFVLGRVRGTYWSWDATAAQPRWNRVGKIAK